MRSGIPEQSVTLSDMVTKRAVRALMGRFLSAATAKMRKFPQPQRIEGTDWRFSLALHHHEGRVQFDFAYPHTLQCPHKNSFNSSKNNRISSNPYAALLVVQKCTLLT